MAGLVGDGASPGGLTRPGTGSLRRGDPGSLGGGVEGDQGNLCGVAGDSSSLVGETIGKLAGVNGGLNCPNSLVGVEPRLASEDPA